MTQLENDGFPRLARTAEQLESITRNIVRKAPRVDRTAEENAATRLLSREGFDEEVLAKGVRDVELRLTFEDVFPLDRSSVDNYLKSVHETLMLVRRRREPARRLRRRGRARRRPAD